MRYPEKLLSKCSFMKTYVTISKAYWRWLEGEESLPDGVLTPAEVLECLRIRDGHIVLSDPLIQADSYLRSLANSRGWVTNPLNLVCSAVALHRLSSISTNDELESFQLPLRIELSNPMARTPGTVCPIILLLDHLGDSSIKLDLRVVGNVQYDFSVLEYLSKSLGHYGVLNQHKPNLFPFGVGSILALFHRADSVHLSKGGVIISQCLVEVKEVTDTHVVVQNLKASYTLEENIGNYLQIDPENRYLFADLLDESPSLGNPERIAWDDLGFSTYFGNSESTLLAALDTTPEAVEGVTVTIRNGELTQLDLSELELAHWILSQRGYPINEARLMEDYSVDPSSLPWVILGEKTPADLIEAARWDA